ncbi:MULTISPECIES: hypothetical protein [Cysteiniphilum]|uniref:hypothetical protein n=1 Tax=Cysteiniphilum TaxID=2056696 RepID=UPI001782161C|nr:MULTISPECIES: hypothetical protein [Cysteiniphilum]
MSFYKFFVNAFRPLDDINDQKTKLLNELAPSGELVNIEVTNNDDSKAVYDCCIVKAVESGKAIIIHNDLEQELAIDSMTNFASLDGKMTFSFNVTKKP